MSGIERRLTKLEAASGHTAPTVVVFVSFLPGPDLHDTATVDGRVWHREPDELEEAFQSRVAREARLARPADKVLVAFLDKLVAPRAESRSEAAEASGRRLPLPSFVKLELMGRD
jgi:hypothetical protein